MTTWSTQIAKESFAVKMLATAAIVAVTLVSGVAEAEIAAGQVVLNCEIEEDASEAPTTQITIDEANGFVIYTFQHYKSSDPSRAVELEDGSKGRS